MEGAEHFTVANDEMNSGGFAFGQHDPLVFVDLNLDIAERGFLRKTDGVVWVLFSEYFGGFNEPPPRKSALCRYPGRGFYILIQKIFTIYTTPWLTPVRTRAKIKYEFVF